MPKILGLVSSCGKCPNYRYYSAERYQCSLVDQVVLDGSVVASFCPLADFPAELLASMDRTIHALREPNVHALNYAFLSHIATKLGVLMRPAGTSLSIGLRDGTKIVLDVNHVTAFTLMPCEVLFTQGDRSFKLYPDTNPPQLREKVEREGLPKGDHWRTLDLA